MVSSTPDAAVDVEAREAALAIDMVRVRVARTLSLASPGKGGWSGSSAIVAWDRVLASDEVRGRTLVPVPVAVEEAVEFVRTRVLLAVDGRGRRVLVPGFGVAAGVFEVVEGGKLDRGVGVVVLRFAMDTDLVRNVFSSEEGAVDPVLARDVAGLGVSAGFVVDRVLRTLIMEALFVIPDLGAGLGVAVADSVDLALLKLRRLASEPFREWALSLVSRAGGPPVSGVLALLAALVTEALRECVAELEEDPVVARPGAGRADTLAVEDAREGRAAVMGLTAVEELTEDVRECEAGTVAAALAADDAVDALATDDVREWLIGRVFGVAVFAPAAAAFGVETVLRRALGRVDDSDGRLEDAAFVGDLLTAFVGDLFAGVGRAVDLADALLDVAVLLETAALVVGVLAAVGVLAEGVDRTELIDDWCRNVEGPARGDGESPVFSLSLFSLETGRLPVRSGRGGPLITVGVGLLGLPREGDTRLRDPTETTRVFDAAVGLRGVGPDEVGVCRLDCDAAAALEAARDDVTDALDAELESRSRRRPLRSDGSGVSTPRRVDTDARFACPGPWLV